MPFIMMVWRYYIQIRFRHIQRAPGESFYTDSDGIKYTLTYQPCYFKDGSLCIALDYLKLMDYSYYTVDDTMKSIWVFNDWSEQSRASLLKDTKARTQAGIKNDIVASLSHW